jgi:hypothetical protein
MECQTQLLLFKFPLDTVKILDYPQEMWGEQPSERWLELCGELSAYEPSGPQLEVKNVSRKWEMVSAYQKSVRRGHTDRALWLVTGFGSFLKKERAYFWKRICTTATEDVGFGDVELMNFVIACSQCYPPSRPIYELKQVWSFLTEKMCQADRSRIFCQLSIIEGLVKGGKKVGELSDYERKVVRLIMELPEATKKQQWAIKNDWRGEGMLKYQNMVDDIYWEGHKADPDVSYELLAGLPDYCYDMHTRIGSIVCNRLSKLQSIAKHLSGIVELDTRTKAVGWALFFVEGGQIAGGMVDPRLSTLEQRFVAAKFGLSLATWQELLNQVREAKAAGLINQKRLEILETWKSYKE